jgi:hypothetical protein
MQSPILDFHEEVVSDFYCPPRRSQFPKFFGLVTFLVDQAQRDIPRVISQVLGIRLSNLVHCEFDGILHMAAPKVKTSQRSGHRGRVVPHQYDWKNPSNSNRSSMAYDAL